MEAPRERPSPAAHAGGLLIRRLAQSVRPCIRCRDLHHLASRSAQRLPRIAALERELEELRRVEEVLVVAALATGQPVHRSPSAPPAAVLGVRVADKVSRAA